MTEQIYTCILVQIAKSIGRIFIRKTKITFEMYSVLGLLSFALPYIIIKVCLIRSTKYPTEPITSTGQ